MTLEEAVKWVDKNCTDETVARLRSRAVAKVLFDEVRRQEELNELQKNRCSDCACSEVEVFDRAVNRFLSWPLPRDFAPDAGITFNPGHVPHGSPLWPTGTNLLNESQAREMIKHVLGVV